jgi:hypothetical protein
MQVSLRDMLALTADTGMQMHIKFSPAESYGKKHTACGCAAPVTSASASATNNRSTEQMLANLTPAKRKSLDSLLALLVGQDD